ncbi:indolepyruvate/phenylpyruvate decarboxylase [Algihabitans albus]|uniref:indolepyruvate/phenylpyruvate decarboxylase n=1 Tax=Algihabitans albus TaxID=2164067 RepID=UPI0035CED869
MNLAESLLHALKDHGAREIFGIPGDFALPFFKVVEQSGILPLYTFSHEPAVGFAADAAARFGSRLGVAAVTYGAGAFNLVNPVACALAERSPLVVISGAPGRAERASGLLLHHQAKTLDSQFRVMAELTCDQAVLDDPTTAPGEIARVLRSAVEQSMPVYIEIPRDLVFAETAPTQPLPATPADAEALTECADEILERLAKAERPALMVGVEIRRFGLEHKVARLAEKLGLPVVTSFMGRGLLAESPAQPLGTYLGAAGKPEVTELVEGSDGLLLLGVILCDTNFGVSEKQINLGTAMHALGREVRVSRHVFGEIPLEALVEALLARAVPVNRQRGEPVAGTSYPADLNSSGETVAPTDIARAVNDLMRTQGTLPIVSDVGDCLFTAMEMENTELAANGYYAGMGFGVPGGLGAQAASGKRALILVGDGAFQMTGWELGNCRRYGWDPIVIVYNNESWEMLRAFQPESEFNDLSDWRFAEMAEPLGGDGVRVRTKAELKTALDKAVATRGRFQLIEVMLQRGAMSDTLSRFVEGVKKGRGQS